MTAEQVLVLEEAAKDLEEGMGFYYDYDGQIARVIAILDMRRSPVWRYDQLRSRK